MAEFTYNPVQSVGSGQGVIFNTTIGCSKGYVFHRNESGIVILKGGSRNPSCCNSFARYQVLFNGNIAVPEGGTPGEISLAIAIDGEPIQTSLGAVTPTVADAYFNVSSPAFVTVPAGTSVNVSVENTSGQAINVRNANLVITRVA